ncbi:MAG: uroporphyrinogen-III decarboxylase-like protein, partial [Spirochaetota bacterium]
EYARLAHAYNKLFWLHSCGNLALVIEYLIDEVGIDAYHSFQDIIIPVSSFKEQYEKKTAALGGVDMDALCRMPEKDLRMYIQGILHKCVPGGRYAFGSGNTIANYIPVDNYLIMLEEGRSFSDYLS